MFIFSEQLSCNVNGFSGKEGRNGRPPAGCQAYSSPVTPSFRKLINYQSCPQSSRAIVLSFFFFNSFAKSVFTGQEATKLLPMPKIYGRFPVFILSALFNDADMFFKLKRFLFCIRGFGDSEYEERKAVWFDRQLPEFRSNLLYHSSG